MKIIFTKISSFTLAILILLSTFSFTVEKHFCGDFLVDVSFFGDADNCFTDVKTVCDNDKTVKKKSCCKDEISEIEGQDNLEKTTTEKISFEQQKLIATLFSYKLLFHKIEKEFIPHEYYVPPNLIKDIQVLLEVFVI